MPTLQLNGIPPIPKINLGSLIPGSLIQTFVEQHIDDTAIPAGFYLWVNPTYGNDAYWFLVSIGSGSRAYSVNMDTDEYPNITAMNHGVLDVQV